MKKVYLFAVLCPLLGCSHLSANEQVTNVGSDLQQAQQIHYSAEAKLTGNNQANVFSNVNPTPNKLEQVNNKNDQFKKAEKKQVVEVMSQSKMINVPLINQNPELKYGCEVTSLTMVLNYAGVKVDKMELYRKVKKDNDPIRRTPQGDIIRWGNPHEGFVGDMTGKSAGYAVFDLPIVKLVNHYLPNRAVNLTNQPFENVLQHVSKGYPVVVWTTGDYRLPDRWESWRHGNQVIRTPLDLHAVVLVGYNQHYVFLNDPLSGRKQVKVNKQRFIDSWKALKSRAVSYH